MLNVTKSKKDCSVVYITSTKESGGSNPSQGKLSIQSGSVDKVLNAMNTCLSPCFAFGQKCLLNDIGTSTKQADLRVLFIVCISHTEYL